MAPNFHPFVAFLRGAVELRCVLAFQTEAEALVGAPRLLRECLDLTVAALVCDGLLREGEQASDAIIVRVQRSGTSSSFVFAQRYRLVSHSAGGEPVGDWVPLGVGESILPERFTEPDPIGPTPDVSAFVEENLKRHLTWMGLRDDALSELSSEEEPLFSPRLVLLRAEGPTTVVFPMASLRWAEESCGLAFADNPGSTLGVLLSEEVITSKGRHVRRLRMRCQDPKEDHSWVFTQCYKPAAAGRPSSLSGALCVVGLDESLLAKRDETLARAVSNGAEALAARHLTELSRPTVETLRPERVAVLQHPGPAVRRATDATARIPFAVLKCEFDEGGLRAWSDQRQARSLRWDDIVGVRIRELPPDSPWERSVVFEVVPAAAAGTGRRPVRLVRSTIVNFRALPGGAAVTLRENLRRLGAFVLSANPAARVDPGSHKFFEGGPCPTIASMAALVADDGEFD